MVRHKDGNVLPKPVDNLKTSYVMVRQKIFLINAAQRHNLKTSYVMVRHSFAIRVYPFSAI